ncbi:MAG: hypothetical protein LBR22_10495 [Desulfovibrio sp.]|jgi:hypothetical protein|nr:hypothetical protein [Desulfovibrio sp.]
MDALTDERLTADLWTLAPWRKPVPPPGVVVPREERMPSADSPLWLKTIEGRQGETLAHWHARHGLFPKEHLPDAVMDAPDPCGLTPRELDRERNRLLSMLPPHVLEAIEEKAPRGDVERIKRIAKSMGFDQFD